MKHLARGALAGRRGILEEQPAKRLPRANPPASNTVKNQITHKRTHAHAAFRNGFSLFSALQIEANKNCFHSVHAHYKIMPVLMKNLYAR